MFSLNSIALQAGYVTVVEDRPITFAKYRIPVPFFHFWAKLTHSAARSLCDSWASCDNSALTDEAYPPVWVCVY